MIVEVELLLKPKRKAGFVPLGCISMASKLLQYHRMDTCG